MKVYITTKHKEHVRDSIINEHVAARGMSWLYSLSHNSHHSRSRHNYLAWYTSQQKPTSYEYLISKNLQHVVGQSAYRGHESHF